MNQKVASGRLGTRLPRVGIARACAALVGLAFVVGAQPADASRTRSYAGAWCSYVSGATNSVYAGSISDPSSSTDTVVACPVLGFVGDGFGNGSLDGWNAKVFDRSPANFSCSLVAETATGGGFSQVLDTKATSGYNSPNVTSIGTSSGLGLTLVGEYFYVQCTIPHADPTTGFSHLADIAIYGGPNI